MQRDAEKADKLNILSGQVLDAAIEVHRTLGGPGLLESIYEESLAIELGLRGLVTARQVRIPIRYKGRHINHPLVADLLIENQLILEIKSVEKFNPIFISQLLTYLRLAEKPLGLIINFGEKFVKDGFHRVVNGFPDI